MLVISGDTGSGYQLLDIASDTITVQGNYTNAVLMTVRGNPVREEWALANSNGIDFLDGNLSLIARVTGWSRGKCDILGNDIQPGREVSLFCVLADWACHL